jgi:hypothetical protein
MLLVGALCFLQVGGTHVDVKTLVDRARSARFQQDSTLASYRAVSRQRASVWFGFGRGLVGAIGRDRLGARAESVARIGWHHSLGAWGEVIGSRSIAPIDGEDELDSAEDFGLTLPYYPGREKLWPIGEIGAAMPNLPDWIHHPLDAGADSVYEFSTGDSIGIRLPDGGNVTVREIRVRPRRPDSRLVVGSLWVDVSTGNLVRAAYRPSVPMDLWPIIKREMRGNDDNDDVIRKFGPFTGVIREILVEHGLYQGRFWLPRTRIATAEGTAKGARMTITMEQTFRYEDVQALPQGTRSEFVQVNDYDPRTGRVRRPQWYGVQERTGRCRERGDTSSRWSPDSLLRDDGLSVMYADGVRFRVLVPCNKQDMLHSAELPSSIYEPGEELFKDTDLSALRKDVEGALGMNSQAKWEPLPTTMHYGFNRGLVRYNRIEALSVGVAAERVLGKGYTTGGTARLGIADLEPNAEAFIQRSNVRTDLRATAYRRLSTSNDWGDPLGTGASILAAVFARDDGFYYRSGGADLLLTHRRTVQSPMLSLRLFAERHDVARVETQESIAHWISDTRFQPNILARSGLYAGGSIGGSYAWGADPRGTRLSGAARAEGAGGENSYGRFMMEHTLLRGLPMAAQGMLTAAGGTSTGELPPQRLWLLGGPYTLRGYRAGEMAGDAFWFGRAEVSKGHTLLRPAIFADAGWAGSRSDVTRQGAPLVGVGAGVLAMDGIVRVDVSRGLHRDRLWRLDAYLDIR